MKNYTIYPTQTNQKKVTEHKDTTDEGQTVTIKEIPEVPEEPEKPKTSETPETPTTPDTATSIN